MSLVNSDKTRNDSTTKQVKIEHSFPVAKKAKNSKANALEYVNRSVFQSTGSLEKLNGKKIYLKIRNKIN